ncbi:MAG: multicopper oxidase [Anaerolineae bacterium]|nr:multicopper oxidase [Anaerolineae bacterium]
MIDRRKFLKISGAAGTGIFVPRSWFASRPFFQLEPMDVELILDPAGIPKYQDPMVIPPPMPSAGTTLLPDGSEADYYEIAVQQFQQQILPSAMSLPTTVWTYTAVGHPETLNYPAFTIEAQYNRPVRVKWINGLVDGSGNYLPHILPVDQTLHWANPPGPPDSEAAVQDPYLGPVPIVTHLHGAHVHDESDGYTEAWYLPAANNIPDWVNFSEGSLYDQFKAKFAARWGVDWEPGTATFQYPNDQRATTLWYHDHTLGMTRNNVYAGPAGFYLLRGGDDDLPPGTLPGPAPAQGDPPGMAYYEIPIVIQDRTFNQNGTLFYPDNRAFFEGLEPDQLRIPFEPSTQTCDGTKSDVSPVWNPEFFGNTMVVNGRTWPYLEVEPLRYRFRLLNGCNSRFLILQFEDPNVEVWQIGADGGFLPAPVLLNDHLYPGSTGGATVLMGPAERADVIVDFSAAAGTSLRLLNLGPDEPFGGGEIGVDFTAADPTSTGQVMEFRVGAGPAMDPSTPPAELVLPTITSLGDPAVIRRLSLNEEVSHNIRVVTDQDGNLVMDCDDPEAEVFGPTEAVLGTLDNAGSAVPLSWGRPLTESPLAGETEVWELYNFTADAHPIHVHMVQFEIVNRQALATDAEGMATQPATLVGDPLPPESWESGWKDTVIAYPGQVTRIKAKFDLTGLYVWHCHILEHEDNEMMRPFRVMHRNYLPIITNE